ncbi:MAG: DUF1016 N-terminal domain-containing protein, partial [Paludibacter sp.]|nr:DUF1016 N-terminal domain-containing protein [Paludibacter sp.]
IIEQSRQKVATAVNLTMVYTYYEIGRYIVEDEQNGEQRAEYGKSVLKDLAENLTDKFGKGFTLTNLNQMRQFFILYSKGQTRSDQVKERGNTVYPILQTLSEESQISATLSRKLQTADNQLDSKGQTLSDQLQTIY